MLAIIYEEIKHNFYPQDAYPLVRNMVSPGGTMVKNLPANAVDVSSIPELEISPGEGNGNPLQDSCLGNPMDRQTWGPTVHGVTKSQTQLSK